MAWSINFGLQQPGGGGGGNTLITPLAGRLLTSIPKDFRMTPTAGVLSLSGQQVQVGGPRLITPQAGALLLTGQPVGVGGLPAQVAELVMVNQGGGFVNANSQPSTADPNTLVIQWTPVVGATSYNIYRSIDGSSFTLYDNILVSDMQFTASISSTTMTVTAAPSNPQCPIMPNVRYNNVSGVLAETMINGRYTSSSTTGTGGTGTYPVNRSQTVTSRTFTACWYADTAATNGLVPDTSRPGPVYSYQVSALVGAAEGAQSDNFAMYIYRNGFSNTSNGELSFGGPFPNSIYNSTNFSPVGGPFCLEYTVNGGFQPTMENNLTPEWQGETGAFRYLMFDFNVGPSYSGFRLPNTGCVSHVPTGDVFGKIPALDAFNYAQGSIVSNTWVTIKIPLVDLGLNRNSFTGSISGSTVSVTGVGTGLFGTTGIFDNSGYITGTGIPVPCWIQGDIALTGSGPGGTGPGSSWLAYGGPYNPNGPPNGTNGAAISVTASSDGTWKFWKSQMYKWAICDLGGPSTQVGLNNMRFSRT